MNRVFFAVWEADMDLKKRLEQRFLKYSAIASQSDGSNETIPSSIGQWKMAERAD